MRTKIAFYLDNQNSIDCSNIVESNPGLGGSEYLAILIPTLLSIRYEDLDVSLYCNYKGILPQSLKHIACGSFEKYSRLCINNKETYCVVNYTSADKQVILSNPEVKYIIWCHNFVSWKDLDFFAKQENVVRLIAVSREQLDLYRDHPAFAKSDFIYNAISVDSYKKFVNSTDFQLMRPNNVVYVGSLIECKGFLHLAKVWSTVLRAIPDAQLYVVGKGNLYDEKVQLGLYGLTDERFEQKIMKYLSSHNKIIDSVHFMGIMGQNKFDLLKQCKVGVPNPSGVTETFGLTAVEMQAMGCKVTTIKCPGYLDTVLNKDNLYSSTKQLAEYIIRNLKSNKSEDMNHVMEFIESHFSYDVVMPLWHKLLTSNLPSEDYLHTDRNVMYNKSYHLKEYKEIVRHFKQKNPIFKGLPSLEKVLFKKH